MGVERKPVNRDGLGDGNETNSGFRGLQGEKSAIQRDFAGRLRRVIDERFGGKIIRLAEASGLSDGMLNTYLHAKGLPGYEAILRISEAGGVSPTWLMLELGPVWLDDVDQEPSGVSPYLEGARMVSALQQHIDQLEAENDLLRGTPEGRVAAWADVIAALDGAPADRREALRRLVLAEAKKHRGPAPTRKESSR